MHLHQLKIKNLASLRGEHVIDFDTLAGQDLFAITGETGAGKSTLLNAVSLALYGEVYKTQLNRTDLVTLGERESSIELIFAVKGKRYLAHWTATVRNKKTGELLAAPTVKRFFYEAPLGSDTRVLDVRPEEILALDFDQFSKCVVLNQGEFARFLTASFAERRDILEHLYPSDNLEVVGGLAKRKFEAMQEKLQRLDVQVHGLNEETLFDVETARQTEFRFKQTFETAEARLKDLRPWAQGISDLKGLAQKHREAIEKQTAQQGMLKTRTDEYNQTMTAWRTHQAELEAFEARLEKERPQHEAMDAEARALQVELSTWNEQQKQLTENITRFENQNRRLEVLSQDLKTQREAVGKIQAERRWPGSDTLDKVDWSAWEKIQRDLPLVEQQLKASGENLTTTIDKGKELAQEETNLSQRKSELIAKLPERLQSADRTRLIKEERDAYKRAEFASAERLKLSDELSLLKSERAALAPQLRELNLVVENEALKHALHALQDHLRHSPSPEHCPLCAQSIHATAWEKQKKTWSLESTETTSAEKLVKLQKVDERLETKISDLAKRLSELPVTSVNFDPLHEQFVEELSQIEVQLSHIEKRLQESRLNWKTLQDKQLQLEEQLKLILLERDRIMEATGAIFKAPLHWSPTLLGELLKERELHRLMAEKQRALVSLEQQENQLKLELGQLSTSNQQINTLLTEAKIVLDQRQKSVNDQYPGTSPQIVLKSLQDDWRGRHAKGQVLQQENRQKENLLSDARANIARWEEQVSQLEVLFAELTSRMSQTRAISVSIQEAESVLTPLLADVLSDINAQEVISRDANIEMGKTNKLLEEDQKRRDKKALFEKEQLTSRTEAHRWKRILDVLGQDDMRTYVLSLVEAALIQQTNHELEKLCSARYEIQHNAKKGKLVPEFWVIDRWRDGLLRKVTTLSGGETFMVSLAMALALAEMARGRADIDCFFIDEGFGTLDEDSLEDVMEMLQQVRSRGKQIGLITHVKALSQRLPINLKVTKDARGNSNVGVVWN